MGTCMDTNVYVIVFCQRFEGQTSWKNFWETSLYLKLIARAGIFPKSRHILVDFLFNTGGPTMNKLLLEAKPAMTLFTGSSRVAEKLAAVMKGCIKLEDAGFDWKILGPDVQQVDYVAWVCDQDAYACSGVELPWAYKRNEVTS